MIDTHSEVLERPGAVPMAPLSRGVAFQHVTFHYEDRDHRRILRDVSFEVPVGQMVAIVGLSGAGKTTLVNLIPRFYDVTGGAILVDGVDIRDVTIASLRAQIGMVTQDTVLFDDTVAANIAYGSPGASRGADRGGGARRARARVRGDAARGLRDADRRARPAALRRPAPAAGHRPRAAEGSADPRARRGHLLARRRVGAPRPGRAAAADGEPHLLRHRAPPLDGAPRRCDHRARARRGARGRAARRAAGAGERRLRPALRAADVRQRRRRSRAPTPDAAPAAAATPHASTSLP